MTYCQITSEQRYMLARRLASARVETIRDGQTPWMPSQHGGSRVQAQRDHARWLLPAEQSPGAGEWATISIAKKSAIHGTRLPARRVASQAALEPRAVGQGNASATRPHWSACMKTSQCCASKLISRSNPGTSRSMRDGPRNAPSRSDLHGSAGRG